MQVVSKKGTRCPKENKPREYIGDDLPQEVPETIYYTRLVKEGSLEIAGAPTEPPAGAQKTKSPKG